MKGQGKSHPREGEMESDSQTNTPPLSFPKKRRSTTFEAHDLKGLRAGKNINHNIYFTFYIHVREGSRMLKPYFLHTTPEKRGG